MMRFDSRFKVYSGVTVTTVLSVLLSVFVTLIFKGGDLQTSSLITAVIVPLCVAPLASYWGFEQAYRIERLNEKLRYMVNHDALTNVHSRSYFVDHVKNDRNPGAAVTLMIDADHFKKINDTYGHDVGDQALIHFSSLIVKNCRKSDIVARLGGEEFGVYMRETNLPTAQVIAERIRAEIFKTPLRIGETEIALSASIGLATGGKSEDVFAVVKRADAALYKAKEKGRNRVCLGLNPTSDSDAFDPVQAAG